MPQNAQVPVKGICERCLYQPCLRMFASDSMGRSVPVSTLDGVPPNCPVTQPATPGSGQRMLVPPKSPQLLWRLRELAQGAPGAQGGGSRTASRSGGAASGSQGKASNGQGASESGKKETETENEDIAARLRAPVFVRIENPKTPGSPEASVSSVSPLDLFHAKVESEGFMPGDSVSFTLFLKPAGSGSGEGVKITTEVGRVAEGRKDQAAVAKFQLPQSVQGKPVNPEGDAVYFVAKASASPSAKSTAKDLEVTSPVVPVAPPPRLVLEVATLPHITFAHDSSALEPSQGGKLKALRSTVDAWMQKHPQGKVAFFGHADLTGDEAYNKTLSERRADAVFAALTHAPSGWETLYEKESWGLKSVQGLLAALGFDPGPIDGIMGPKTEAAIRAFQRDRKQAETGSNAAPMRQQLFSAYFEAVFSPALPPDKVLAVNGQPRVGCGEFNPIIATEAKSRANRRVTVVLFDVKAETQLTFPCAQGDIGPCKSQVAKSGKRHSETFRCAFYDECVRKESTDDPPGEGEIPDYPIDAPMACEEGCHAVTEPPAPQGVESVAFDKTEALCGDAVKVKVKLFAPATGKLELQILQKGEDGKAGPVLHQETLAPAGTEFEHVLTVRQAWFAKAKIAEDPKQKKGVELIAHVAAENGHSDDSDSPCLLKHPLQADAVAFAKDYAWNGYSVHAKYQHALKQGIHQIVVNEKVMKAWGGYWIDMRRAGIAGKAGGCPWDGYRWGRVSGMGMTPNEYHDGKAWQKMPKGFTPKDGEYSAQGFIESGKQFILAGNASAVWPEAFAAYDYDGPTYKGKREAWIKDSKARFTGKFRLKRKGCSQPKEKNCCADALELTLILDRINTHEKHAITLCPGTLRSNAGCFFYGESRVAVAAHEVGHLVGLPDEYVGGATDTTQADGDGLVSGIDADSLMGQNLSSVKARHFVNFLATAGQIFEKTLQVKDTFTAQAQ